MRFGPDRLKVERGCGLTEEETERQGCLVKGEADAGK